MINDILKHKNLDMKRYLHKKVKTSFGFTIIEVMIVLAISALIVVIVFVAVPQTQVKLRDSERKQYLRSLYQAMLEYVKNNDRLPSCDSAGGPTPCGDIDNPNNQLAAGAAKFLTNYAPHGKDPSTGEDYVDTDPTNLSAVDPGTWNLGNTTLHFDSAFTPHSAASSNIDIDVVGKVVIGTGHWCNVSRPETDQPGWYPFASTTAVGLDLQLDKFVMAIGVERGRYYCLDNYDAN
jgi:prepilin-type N-terminal cleavage/methylation domain-containing protein